MAGGPARKSNLRPPVRHSSAGSPGLPLVNVTGMLSSMQRDASYDVVVIGAGSGGKPLAGELSRAGISVALVERGLVGGECPYLACIPSKAMLNEARRHLASGPHTAESDASGFATAVLLRDKDSQHRDDSHAAGSLTQEGVELLRGNGVVEPAADGHVVRVTAGNGDVTRLSWTRALVIASGSAAIVPPIDGLQDAGYWTSDLALSSDELPKRLLVLGGGPIGCELAQVYASFGVRVMLVEAGPQLLPRESPWLGESIASALSLLGVDVVTGEELTRVHRTDSAITATVGDRDVEADRLLVAIGKRPRTEGFGLELLGIDTSGPISIDARCRIQTRSGDVLGNVFAVGDVTGLAPYTHTANYHARTVAAQLQGHGADADHTGIPRVVYTDPAVFCAGLTEDQARDAGHQPIVARFDATQTARSSIEQTAARHHHELAAQAPAGVELVADANSGLLLGISAIGPEADSWAAELALAVRTRTTVGELAQALQAFPSWTEAIHPPARELAEKVRAAG